MRKILLVVKHPFRLWNIPPWFPEQLRTEFPDCEVVHLPSYEGVEKQIAYAEIALAFSLRPAQVAAAKKLRWIHATTAAVHQLMIPEIVESDIIVTNSREIHGPVVAEHVIALIFAAAKKIPQSVLLQQRHVWGQQRLWDDGPHRWEIAGATLGLVGLGSIGREVVKRAKPLGLRVIACREHPEKGPDGADAVYGPAQLNDMLGRCDYVVLAAPATSSTQALMNEERLACLKPEA
jgi:phosphoglycerate dehydrogenase-like enzyme